MRMRFCLGKALRFRESSTSIVRLCPTITSASIGGARQSVAQIPSMDAILMGYWVTGQVRNIWSSAKYKSKLMMGDMTHRRVIMIQCEMFLRYHLRSTRGIDLLGSVRNRVDLRDEAL